MALENVILKHEDVFYKNLDIVITSSDIIDQINAFDWLDLSESKTEIQFNNIAINIFLRFNFKYPKKYESIIKKRFIDLLIDAIRKIKQSITAVSKSYNIVGAKQGFQNDVVNKFYYIEYWANKKMIPVNYNEKNHEKRALFNLDTIILSILSDKLTALNNYELNKPKH